MPVETKAKQKKPSAAQKKPTSFSKPVNISPELAAVVGKGPMPRTEITQKLWAYIKEHNLQNPKNKKEILPDEKLAAIFGKKTPVDMFVMTKLVSAHVKK